MAALRPSRGLRRVAPRMIPIGGNVELKPIEKTTQPVGKVTAYSKLDPNAVVRRYLDLPKYIQLLRSRKLYFARVDQFPDKFEGVLPPGMRKLIDDAYRNGEVAQSSQTRYEQLRTGAYVSCWSLGREDNMALWQLYGTASAGVAVVTTIGDIIKACLKWQEDIVIHKVQYIDHFKNPDMIIGDFLDPLQFKHVGYRYEEEVRLVVGRMPSRFPETQRPLGLCFPVDLDQLIKKVVVGPEVKPWFIDLVSDLTSRYCVSVPIIPSPLSSIPTADCGANAGITDESQIA